MITDMPRLGSDLPLFARDNELATLLGALEQADAGQPAAVLLSGDAGVGKSRLLTEFTTAADGDARVAVGHCLDTADSVLPYLPFAEAVGALTRRDPALLDEHPALQRLLPHHPAARAEHDDDRDLGRLQLFEALQGALTSLAADRPVILALEDLHWADRSSRDLLAFLISRLPGRRLLIVGTYRADALHRRHPLRGLLAELVRLPGVQRLHLDPFGPRDAAAFVRELNTGLDEESVARIAAASEGNAFLAEELASAETDTVTFELAEVLIARLERLPETAQQVVRLASVIGRRFTYKRLNQAVWSMLDETGIESERELDEALRAAVSHGIVTHEGGDTYAFRHALLREAVYSDLLPGERSRFHHRIAVSLAEDDSPGAAAELAHHALESDDLPCALAASLRAADEADGLAAPAEELHHLELALRLLDRVPEEQRPEDANEQRLTLRAAAAAAASGEPKRAIAFGKEAIVLTDKLGDPLKSAGARRKYAKSLLVLDGYDEEADAVTDEAWKLVADTEPNQVKAWVQAMKARTSYSASRFDEAGRWAIDAIATADAVGGDGPHMAARADAIISRAASIERPKGDTETVIKSINEALAWAAGSCWAEVELRAHFNLGITHLDVGRLREAVDAFDAGMRAAERHGYKWSPFGLEMGVRQVICNFMLGEWDAAERAAELAGGVVPGVVMVRILAARVLVDVARGRFDVAERRLLYLSDNWKVDGQVMMLMGFCRTELGRWMGRPAEGAVHAERTMERLEEFLGDHFHLAGVAVAGVGVGAYADLAEQSRRAGDAAAAERAVAAGRVLAARARRCVELGVPLSGSLGPEGRAWLAQVEAEATRLDGPGDPDAWRAVIDEFAYGEAREPDLRQGGASQSSSKDGLGPGGADGASSGEVYRQAIGRWRLAEALLARGGPDDRQEASEQLAAARRCAERLGALPLLESVNALSEKARLEPRTGASGPLTPRELSVLRLVAVGKTNRQIGAELYISDKTVSVHLSRAMAKLGAANRAEAVSTAHLRGYLAAG